MNSTVVIPQQRILVVDDDPVARLLQSAALESVGFKVLTADNGAMALDMFATDPPDCLVLDVVMPGMNGYALCDAIRRHPAGQHVPILILTSLDDMESIGQAYAAGATDFSHKGIAPLLLVERVRFLLRAADLQSGLQASEARLEQAQRIARIGHWEIDMAGRTISVSPMSLDLLGIVKHEAKSIEALRLRVHCDDLEKLDASLQGALVVRDRFGLNLRIITPAGHERFTHLEGELLARSHGMASSSIVMTLQDLTSLHQAEERVRLLSHFDSVTGLPNLASLRERLKQAIAEAGESRTQIGLAVVDIEQFSRLNDQVGHEGGNEMLAQVGQRLMQTLIELQTRSNLSGNNKASTVARIDGDGFAVMLPMLHGIAFMTDAMQQLQQAMRAPFAFRGQELLVTVTIGIAVFPDDCADADTLLRLADAALDQAKQANRGSHQFYSARLQERATTRRTLESDLRHALQRDQFEVWYQPRVGMSTLSPVGCEALLRWRHPQHGLVSPVDFIPVAEELGLIVEIGEWVLHTACVAAKAWSQRNMEMRVSVNVSAVQFQRAAMAAQVTAALHASTLPARLLELEVTEGVLIDRPQSVSTALERMREAGVHVALDDFGTGYSSLSYLRKLPIDCLKIDRAFIGDVSETNDAGKIVEAILNLARGLRLTTVAEGVETLAQFDFLSKRGCDEIQGFLFARPMPDTQLAVWFSQWLANPWHPTTSTSSSVSVEVASGVHPDRAAG